MLLAYDMATLETFTFFSFFSFFSFLFFLFPHISTTTATCGRSKCTRGGPPVRFPFLLTTHQSPSCGYQGFDLSCNNRKETIITLPSSDNFTVLSINYRKQTVSIDDPDNCLLPKRFHNNGINITDSPFLYMYSPKNYTLLRCTSDPWVGTLVSPVIISCLSSWSYKVVVVPTPVLVPWAAHCSVVTTALVPNSFDWQRLDLGAQFAWVDPDCHFCEAQGRFCGLDINAPTSSQIQCHGSSKSGLSSGVKYGLIIGVGIPGLLCIIGLANYVWARITAHGRPNQPITDLSASTAQQPATVIVGLDGPTIESYPKTLLGESRRLPKPNDNTCSICLSEYQPKEALRTIPECNHYFHASCIDEWLKMNATCPVCRNSPEGSSLVNPSSLSSSSSSSSLASTTRI